MRSGRQTCALLQLLASPSSSVRADTHVAGGSFTVVLVTRNLPVAGVPFCIFLFVSRAFPSLCVKGFPIHTVRLQFTRRLAGSISGRIRSTSVDVQRIHILYSPCGPPPWRVALCRAWFTPWYFSAPAQRVIPRSYVVDVSDTRVVSRNDVSQDGFSLKHSAKVESVLPDNLFWPWNKTYYLR